MAINMEALLSASTGDPTAKVTVSKSWLAEVHRLLTIADVNERRLADALTRHDMGDRIAGIGEKLTGMFHGAYAAEHGRRA